MEELREKIAERIAIQTLEDESLSGIYVWQWVVENGFEQEYLNKADQIFALVKEAGYVKLDIQSLNKIARGEE